VKIEGLRGEFRIVEMGEIDLRRVVTPCEGGREVLNRRDANKIGGVCSCQTKAGFYTVKKILWVKGVRV